MDDTLKERPETTLKTSHFLCCFGFSREPLPEKKPMKAFSPDSRRKKRWSSWSGFRLKNSSTKTVPVDSSAVSEEVKSTGKAHALKSKLKRKSDKVIASKHEFPVNNRKETRQVPERVLPSDQTSVDIYEETWYGSAQEIILENGKSLDHVDTPKRNKSQSQLSFRRKIDAIITGSSRPGSPEPKTKSIRTVSMTRVLPSSPTQIQGKRAAAHHPVNSQVTAARKTNTENHAIGNKLDSVVGLTIILVILIIMVFWGRVCAILCTSAWFYFIPRTRTWTNHDTAVNGSFSVEPDFDSEEYKKKVVLEGLLQRNHRSKP